jgi:hypothetical protein
MPEPVVDLNSVVCSAILAVLQRHGLVIAHDLPSREVPELVVKVRTAEAGWEAATRVWVEAYTPSEEPVGPDGTPLKYLVFPT